jgi:hypothetical protein
MSVAEKFKSAKIADLPSRNRNPITVAPSPCSSSGPGDYCVRANDPDSLLRRQKDGSPRNDQGVRPGEAVILRCLGALRTLKEDIERTRNGAGNCSERLLVYQLGSAGAIQGPVPRGESRADCQTRRGESGGGRSRGNGPVGVCAAWQSGPGTADEIKQPDPGCWSHLAPLR